MVSVWVLISISTGAYNAGNVSVVRQFESEVRCLGFKKRVELIRGEFTLGCVEDSPSMAMQDRKASQVKVGDLVYIDGIFTPILHVTHSNKAVYINRKYRFNSDDVFSVVD